MEILVILIMEWPKAFFELLRFSFPKLVDKTIFEVFMFINVAIIKKSGGNLQFLDQYYMITNTWIFIILKNYLDRRASNTNLFR